MSAEIERKKLKKVLRALKYKIGLAQAGVADSLKPVKTEVVRHIKALNLLRDATKRETEMLSGGFSSLLQAHSLQREISLLTDLAAKDPEQIAEPLSALLCALFCLYVTIKLFMMQIAVLTTPLPSAVPPPTAEKKSNKAAPTSTPSDADEAASDATATVAKSAAKKKKGKGTDA